MIDRSHALPLSQQARLVGIARSSVYYRGQPVSEADQLLMRRIDELHMEVPFAGARMLRLDGHEIGRRRVWTLMKRMGIEALYCKPNTSRRNAQHKIWPYLLRGMTINRANQVWALDTGYIPMARAFVYLTRRVGLSQPEGAGPPRGDHDGGDARCRGVGRSVREVRAT
jgi:putative transposase